MNRRHVGEFMKTHFANSGRLAGMGVLFDDYGDESNPKTYIANQHTPAKIAEREIREEEPVITYYIEVEQEEVECGNEETYNADSSRC